MLFNSYYLTFGTDVLHHCHERRSLVLASDIQKLPQSKVQIRDCQKWSTMTVRNAHQTLDSNIQLLQDSANAER